jgi:hypothetical protein
MDALPLIFQAIDLDDDGKISFDEFKLFFRSFDVADEKFSKQVNLCLNYLIVYFNFLSIKFYSLKFEKDFSRIGH